MTRRSGCGGAYGGECRIARMWMGSRTTDFAAMTAGFQRSSSPHMIGRSRRSASARISSVRSRLSATGFSMSSGRSCDSTCIARS